MKSYAIGAIGASLFFAVSTSSFADERSGQVSQCKRGGANIGLLPDPLELSINDSQCLTDVWLCGSLSWTGRRDSSSVTNTVQASTTAWLGSATSRCGPPAIAPSVAVSATTKGSNLIAEAKVNVEKQLSSNASGSASTNAIYIPKVYTPEPACGASSVHTVKLPTGASYTLTLNDPC
jgi:hypothetical protein